MSMPHSCMAAIAAGVEFVGGLRSAGPGDGAVLGETVVALSAANRSWLV
jgi:hypothetical protein